MRVRLASHLAAKLEGIRQGLSYPCLSDTANVLLDVIRGHLSLSLVNLSQIGTEETRIRLAERHREWLTDYGRDRGINVSAALNVVLSEYFLGIQAQTKPQPTTSAPATDTQQPAREPAPPPTQVTAQETQPKPKGNSLLRGLKI